MAEGEDVLDVGILARGADVLGQPAGGHGGDVLGVVVGVQRIGVEHHEVVALVAEGVVELGLAAHRVVARLAGGVVLQRGRVRVLVHHPEPGRFGGRVGHLAVGRARKLQGLVIAHHGDQLDRLAGQRRAVVDLEPVLELELQRIGQVGRLVVLVLEAQHQVAGEEHHVGQAGEGGDLVVDAVELGHVGGAGQAPGVVAVDAVAAQDHEGVLHRVGRGGDGGADGSG